MASSAPASRTAAPPRRSCRRGPARALALAVAAVALVALASSAGAAGRNPVTDIAVEPHGTGRVVRIRTESAPTFTVFRLSDPMRVVVDISGGDVSAVSTPISVEDGVLGQIAVRQFSADGFRIGRVMVGFDAELPYQVFADGNAVVVTTGDASAPAVSRVAPPPVAPVDRAAAERLESARAEADEAAKRAAGERKAAEEAAATARRQQEEAQRVAAEADRRAADAAAAKAEAERMRAQAQAAAQQDRARAETALTQAEERLRDAEDASRRVARERAEAERLAAQARRAQSDAEQAAAEAEAKAKAQEAELEERIAKAQSEQRAAEQARARAAQAKNEAVAAQKAADQARAAAERVRTETARRLDEIAAREARIEADSRALAAERKKLEGERQTLAASQRQVEAERARQLQRQKELEAARARETEALAAAERERKKAEEALRAAAERERGVAAREQQARARAEHEAAAHEKELAERERKAREQALAEAAAREQALAVREKQARAAAEQAQAEARAARTRVQEQSRLLARASHEAPAPRSEGVVFASATQPAAAPAAATTPRRLRCSGVSTSADGAGRILVATDGAPRFAMQRIEAPPRLVIDLEATTRSTRRTSFPVKLAWAQRVRLGDHGDSLRVVVDLARADLAPSVTATATGLSVTVPAPTTAARDPSSRGGTGGPAEPAADPTGDGGPVAQAATGEGAGGAAAVSDVKDVRFERRGGTARVVVQLAGTPTAVVDDRSSKTWVLQLRDTRVPKGLERSLDTGAYQTVVSMVSTYQASENPLVANVVVSLAGAASQKLSQEGTALVWEIEGEATPAPIAAGAAPQTAAFATEATVVARSMPRATREKRVNMRLKDADLVNVIRFIADVTGENIIVSEDIKGKVTVNLRNVPWEQALDTILKSRGYDKVRSNNIIRIATADEIQKEREREVQKRKALQESGETVIRMIPVSYAVARELIEQLKPLLSPRGTIQVDERTNTLVVEDLPENIKRIVELARRLDRQTPQVLIEARIVEASSNFEQEIGIQWGGVGQASSRYGNQTGLVFPSDVIAQGAADDTQTVTSGTLNPGRFAVNLPAAIGAGVGGGVGFIFGSAGGGQLLSLRLSALESNGSGRIISSPRIATLDNRTARIAQGIDIPISTVSAAGTNTRFIPANLELEVTPHVTNDGTVLLRLKTSKNEPDFANRGANGDPTIVKKSAETEVMVRDGDTAVIGGIYTRNTSQIYSEVPLFGKIPLLGWLFKKRRSEDRRAELLVFITPRIINRESSLAGNSTLSPDAGPGQPGSYPGAGQPGETPGPATGGSY